MPLPLPFPGAFSRGAGGSFLPFRDGVIDVNLGGITDSNVTFPFINMAKMGRRWEGNVTGALSSSDLDANGYPTTIPATNATVISFFAWTTAEHSYILDRNLVLTWDGDATVSFVGGTVVSSAANRIVLTVTATGNKQISVSNLGTTGISNVKLFFEDQEALLNAGEIFNPEWLNLFRQNNDPSKKFHIRRIRFMDWTRTNVFRPVNYSEISTLDSYNWWNNTAKQGMPLEVMVALCNKVNASMWYTFSPVGSDAYVNTVAGYVRDNLAPTLQFAVERGNEQWNSAFAAFEEDLARGVIDFGDALTGTLATNGTTTVTGTGTSFLSEVTVGDVLAIGLEASTVASVASDTSLTVGAAFTGTASGLSGSVGGFWQRNFAVKDATRIAGLCDTVFAAASGPAPSLFHVFGIQSPDVGDATTCLAASVWQAAEPGSWVDPAVTFDAFAATSYFGGNVIKGFETIAGMTASVNGTTTVTVSGVDLTTVDPAPRALKINGDLIDGTVTNATTFTLASAHPDTASGLAVEYNPNISELQNAYDVSDAAGNAVLNSLLAEPGLNGSFESRNTVLRAISELLEPDGVDLILYEGGSHIVHSFAITDITSAQGDFMIDTVWPAWLPTEEAAEAFEEQWRWSLRWSNGPFMVFSLDGPPWSKFGTWTHYIGMEYGPFYGNSDARLDHLNGLTDRGRWFGDDKRPTIITPLPTISGNAGSGIDAVDLRPSFSKNRVTVAVTGLPSGLSFDDTTYEITGTPSAEVSGTYTLTVSNGVGSVEATGSYAIDAAIPLPTPVAVTFDGTNDSLSRSAALVGASNSTSFTIRVVVSTSATGDYILGDVGGGIRMLVNISGAVRLIARSDASTALFDTTFGSSINDGTTKEIEISYDGSTGAFRAYVNDASVASSTLAAGTVFFSGWTPVIGGRTSAADLWTGTMTRVTVWQGVALDLTSSAVRTSMADPAQAGTLGTNIIDVFGAASDWNAGTNWGTGGAFTVAGAVT